VTGIWVEKDLRNKKFKKKKKETDNSQKKNKLTEIPSKK
jgi:hypothetical protein